MEDGQANIKSYLNSQWETILRGDREFDEKAFKDIMNEYGSAVGIGLMKYRTKLLQSRLHNGEISNNITKDQMQNLFLEVFSGTEYKRAKAKGVNKLYIEQLKQPNKRFGYILIAN